MKAGEIERITNDAPVSIMFSQNQFFVIQNNYPSLKEIAFTDYLNKKFACPHDCTVAIFTVKPKQKLNTPDFLTTALH